MYRLIRWFVLLMVLISLWASPVDSVSSQEPGCPGMVNEAFQVVDQVCGSAGNNQACYAHARLDAIPQPHVQSLVFNQAGDIADVEEIQSLRLSPMDLDSGLWGVGLLRVRTHVPNANARGNASILLFGDVRIDNAVRSPTVRETATIRTTGGASARVRTAPFDGLVIAALPSGQAVFATGRTEDGSWVRIEMPDTERPGWVHASLLAEADGLLSLPAVEPDSAQYGSMQAFAFTTGHDDATCSEAPNSGLLVQTPEGEARVNFLINEVNISLGSTAYIQAAPGSAMSIYLIEGSSQVTARNISYGMVAGTVISVPLDEAGIAAGPPSLPASYDPADLNALPVEHLERPVTIAPPLDEISLGRLNRANLGKDDEDAEADTGDELTVDDGLFGGGEGDPGAGPAPMITICHNGKNTITINANAWSAHAEHGDTQGPCPEVEEPAADPTGGDSGR